MNTIGTLVGVEVCHYNILLSSVSSVFRFYEFRVKKSRKQIYMKYYAHVTVSTRCILICDNCKRGSTLKSSKTDRRWDTLLNSCQNSYNNTKYYKTIECDLHR